MMSANNDEPSAVNGRLRPRKPSIALLPPPRNMSLRRYEGKLNEYKTNKTNSLKNERKTDKFVIKPDPESIEFLCPYCDKKFSFKKSVAKHVSCSHVQEGKVITCQFCNHIENDPMHLMQHMLEAHPNQYFACLDCRTRFTSSNELKAHNISLCRKRKPPGPYRNSPFQSKEKNDTKKFSTNKDGAEHDHEDESGFQSIVIACELKPNQIEDPTDIERNITTNLIMPTNKSIVSSSTLQGKGPVLVIDEAQWNKRLAGNFSFHKSEADQILSRLGVVHRSPGAAAANPRSHTYKYIEESTKFEKCFDTVFYSKVASNVQENLDKFLDGSFNRTPLDPDSIIKTRKSKNHINTAEGFPILLSSEQFSRTAFGAYLPRAIAPRHKWKRDSIENEKHIVSPDQLLGDSHAINCIVTLVSSLDIWTQLCMRRKFEDKYNNTSFNEKKTEKQHVISNELKEILESRELPARSACDEKSETAAARQMEGVEFPMSLGLCPVASQQPPPPPALLSGEWVRPRCFVCCACGEHTRDPKALVNHLNAQHPTANVSHYDIAGDLLCNDDSILKNLYVPSNQTPNRTRPLRGIRECTKCSKSISLEELHQHMLECAGDTPVVKRKCRYRPFGVRRRRPRMPDNAMRKKIRRNICKRKTRQNKKIRSRSRVRSEVGDAETIRKMIADLPAKRHRASENGVATTQHWNRKRDITRKQRLRNRPTINTVKNTEKQQTQKDPKNSLKCDSKVKKKDIGNTGSVSSNALSSRPRVTSRILRKGDLKRNIERKNALRRSPRSANQPIETYNEEKNSNKTSVCISSAVQTDELSFRDSSDRVDVNRSRGKTSEHAARSNSSSSQPSKSARTGDNSVNTNNQQVTRPHIKHSIARLTAPTETHDKAVQFQPHFLVNQECAKTTNKPYLLSEPQVFYENDIMAARLDKPPLINYNQKSPVDPYAFQRSKLNKPRKGLNDCIAMLKNKLVEPSPPPLHSFPMNQTHHGNAAAMPLSYAPLEMMTSLTMLPDVQFDVPTSIPYAHANTNAVSIISAPLDLSGKKSTYSASLSNEYETLDLSQKNTRNTQNNYPPHFSEGGAVDLCMKSVRVAHKEQTLDLSKRSKQFDESPLLTINRPFESRPIEHPPIYDYDFRASQYGNHSKIHLISELGGLQQQASNVIDFNLDRSPLVQPIAPGYPRASEYERITQTHALKKNTISPSIDRNLSMQLKPNHENENEREYNTSTVHAATVESVQSKCTMAEFNTTAALEKGDKENTLQGETPIDDAAKKIALLPKEIVEILGKMPADHRNQLLDVLPQYLGCNTSVKQLKLVVDINPEALISPMGISTLKSASNEISTQTFASSAQDSASATKVIAFPKQSIETGKEEKHKDAKLTETICINTPGPTVACEVINARDAISLQNLGLGKDVTTGYTIEKPKEIKEKTASSLRAVRIKTSSQRRHTQSVPEIKPLKDVPNLIQPDLTASKENVAIQQAEVSSTQHSNISANSVDILQQYTSQDTENSQGFLSNKSDSKTNLEVDKNNSALQTIANASTCDEMPPLREKMEHDEKEAISNHVLPSEKEELTNSKAPPISDGDSEDDISLATIVKQKMADCQNLVNPDVNTDLISIQKKKKKTRKLSIYNNRNKKYALENKNITTTCSGLAYCISKDKDTCLEVPDVYVNKTSAVAQTLYQSKKLRTRCGRSSKKEEQLMVIEKPTIENETKVSASFDIIQNKENNVQTDTNIDKHLSNPENLASQSKPCIETIENNNSETHDIKGTKVSCVTIQDIELIKPNNEVLNQISKSESRINEKKAGKQKRVVVHKSVDCIKTHMKEPININININRQNTSPVPEEKSPLNTMSNDDLKSAPTVNCNESFEDYQKILASEDHFDKCVDTAMQSKTNFPEGTHLNKKLRRSRRVKTENKGIQAISDSPIALPDDEKSGSVSYMKQKNAALSFEIIHSDNSLNPNIASINEESLDNVEIKTKKKTNNRKNKKLLTKEKSDIFDEVSGLEALEIDLKLQCKPSENELYKNVSLQKTEKENTEKFSMEDKIITPTTISTVSNLSTEKNPDAKENPIITVNYTKEIEKNKHMKHGKKSKSVSQKKYKNQLSSRLAKNDVESALAILELSENANAFVFRDKDHLSMSPGEPKKGTCYDLSREHAVTGSKSNSSQNEDSITVHYDPYDIDQEDNLVEKFTSLKKASPNVKIFPVESSANTLEANDTSQIFAKIDETKTTVLSSDSDDSSKSDVPLKKLVDEKMDRKNNITNFQKSSKSHSEEATTSDMDTPLSTLSEERLRSEQFMESFGFFSERRPRKSNILAAKKISETFQNDDMFHGGNKRSNKKIDRNKSITNVVSADFPIKCSMYCSSKKAKRGRKRRLSKDVTYPYCCLCEKAFRRSDNYLRHIMSNFHLTKVLQKEMHYEVETIPEQPNCLIIYRQHLERIRRLTEKIKKKNKKLGIIASPPKFELPSLAEIMAEAKLHTYSGPGVERRGLSRDEALFIDCCELLKESHKNEKQETLTLETSVSEHRELLNPVSKIIAEDRADSKSDGDVDSITAKTILESEEVRNLENDLLSGLKEAAAKRQFQINNQIQSPNSQSLDNYDLDLDTEPARLDQYSVTEDLFSSNNGEKVSDEVSSPKAIVLCSEEPVIADKKKRPKKPKPKIKIATDVDVDIYEDKFDKIKRKCRSQAAAAKVIQTTTDLNTSIKANKKSDNKKMKKTLKNVKHNSIPTKGALKGFECIKLSECVEHASSSDPGYEVTPPSKRKKSSFRSNKKERKEPRREPFKRSSEMHGSNAYPRATADIYEFLDNDDGDALHYRGTSIKDKIKTYNDTPSTSKIDPIQQPYDLSGSGSDVDDFVYMSDDYLCSDDETENSLLSSELSSSCKVPDSRRPSKRKETLEKSALMGKIFKNNAVRNERKPLKTSKETTNASKANLDQLFDSLLEDEPNSSMLKEDADLAHSNRASSPAGLVADATAVTTSSQSCNDSMFNSPRDQTIKRKKSKENKKVKQKRSKIHGEGSLEGKTYKKNKQSLPDEREELAGDSYGVAQHRARRKCTVGKQNVLAETWSSESESDSPRPTTTDTPTQARKRRSKKIKHSAPRLSKQVSFGKYEKEIEENDRAADIDSGPGTSSKVKRNVREGRGRSHSEITYFYSSEEEVDAHPQQHGWIVGNSHKKLVTMLAHAKGRKRDDKLSYID